jgi:UDP-N-acetylglucosamine:LPS N-acetylglucosamine transferase
VNVLYYTTGVTGSGHQVIGISIANALRRSGAKHIFTLLTNNTKLADLVNRVGVSHREVPLEDERQLSAEAYSSSALYQTITELNPDVLIVTMHWFMLSSFIRDLPCRKVFLWCAGHVYQLWGESPLANLMEVKA